jgi:hypothetical protein
MLRKGRHCVSNVCWNKVKEVVQRKIERRSRLTRNRRCSPLIVAARRLLAQAAWRRLARVLGGTSADGGVVYMGVLRGKGARVLNQIRRISAAITLGIVFILVSLGGMTCGVALSATEGGKRR